jgi:hypothetical protein
VCVHTHSSTGIGTDDIGTDDIGTDVEVFENKLLCKTVMIQVSKFPVLPLSTKFTLRNKSNIHTRSSTKFRSSREI